MTVEQLKAQLPKELVDASEDVDLRVLRWARSLSPRERLHHAASMSRTIQRFRRVKTTDR